MSEEQDEAAWVLLVEDEEDDAELIARAFRRAGIANPLERVVDGDAAGRGWAISPGCRRRWCCWT